MSMENLNGELRICMRIIEREDKGESIMMVMEWMEVLMANENANMS